MVVSDTLRERRGCGSSPQSDAEAGTGRSDAEAPLPHAISRVRMSQHLLTVWNPAYADSVMDAHLAVLLRWAERYSDGQAKAEDRYVWWGKVKSPNRQQPLPHVDDVLALRQQIDAGVETHLYLTDYRSLYVGHLEDIEPEDFREAYPDEADHLPSYYADLKADFWFLLTDLRLLVSDDTVAVIEELKKLRNVRYHGRPVSLYGGMVELPLIVTRDDGGEWFADEETLTDGRLWAEHDAERRADTERMARELRDNLIGRRLWTVLQPATRNFLASAEAVFRARRDDPRFDFSGPGIGYAKAVETELNALIFPLLRKTLGKRRPADREVVVEGRKLDLGGIVQHQSLGMLKHLLQHDRTVREAVRAVAQQDAAWLTDALPAQLAALVDMRNPAAHGGQTGREAVSDVRDEVLGVGGEGIVVRVAGIRARALA